MITQLRFGLSHFKKHEQMLSKLDGKKKYTFVVNASPLVNTESILDKYIRMHETQNTLLGASPSPSSSTFKGYIRLALVMDLVPISSKIYLCSWLDPLNPEPIAELSSQRSNIQ